MESVFILSIIIIGGTGNITIQTAATTVNPVTANGPNRVEFYGASANTYVGTVTVNNGTIALNMGTAGFDAITGDLTIRGVIRSVALDADPISPEIKGLFGEYRRGTRAVGKISRKEFGLKSNTVLEAGAIAVGDEVEITIVDVRDALSRDSHAERVIQWARCVWESWSEHHDTAQAWVETARASGYIK